MAGEDSWKYERIADELRTGIRGGKYAPGSRLPSKSELKAAHGTSDGPVNEAIRILRDEGLVETRQGSGTFVCDPVPAEAQSEYEALMSRVDAIAEELRQLRGEVAALKEAREA
jgi:DNA-binding GntR family transcriptional regulator